MVTGVEFQERQAFNREIWSRTKAAICDQFQPIGPHSKSGLAVVTWKDRFGLMLPSPNVEIAYQRNLVHRWHNNLQLDNEIGPQSVVPSYRFPDALKFKTGADGLLTSLDFISFPDNLKKGEGPSVYSWLLQQKSRIKNVAILGAMNARSVNAYYVFLKENGFDCNLHVIDISPVPLAQTRAYMEIGYMKDPVDHVRVIVHKPTDILNLTRDRQQKTIESPDCDLSVADITSLYVYPDESEPDRLARYYENIADLLAKGCQGNGGYHLTREQVRLTNVTPRNAVSPGNLLMKGQDENSILARLGEPTLSDKELAEFRKNIYGKRSSTPLIVNRPETYKGAATKYFDRINGVQIVVPKLSAAYSTELMHVKP